MSGLLVSQAARPDFSIWLPPWPLKHLCSLPPALPSFPALHHFLCFCCPGGLSLPHAQRLGGYLSTFSPNIEEAACAGLALSLSFGDGQRLDSGFRLCGPAWCPGHAWCRASECQGPCGHRAAVLFFRLSAHEALSAAAHPAGQYLPFLLMAALYLASPLCDV